MTDQEGTTSRRTRALAELTQAATRYALAADGSDAERSAATRRLNSASAGAMRAGMTFDEMYVAQHRAMHRAAGPCGPNSTCHNWTK